MSLAEARVEEYTDEELRQGLRHWRAERTRREHARSAANSAYIGAGTNTYREAQAKLDQATSELAYADARIRAFTAEMKRRGLLRDGQP